MSRGPVVIALGGGGARGLAHLGVLEVLEQSPIRPDRIVGDSIGSIVGAAYAFEPDADVISKRVIDYVTSDRFQTHQKSMMGASRGQNQNGDGKDGGVGWFNQIREYLRANRMFNRVVTKKGLLASQLLKDVADNVLPDADIADASIPLTIVAIDLRSGRRVVLEKGNLRKAVRGSASLPGIFPPVELDGMLLSDIGIFSPLPTQECRYYNPSLVIAADVSRAVIPLETCETALGVMMRMEEIAGTVFRDHVLSLADVIIHPDVDSLPWSDFNQAAEMAERGRAAAANVRDELLPHLNPGWASIR